MDKGFRQASGLLAELVGRNGEEHHRADDRGEGVRRRTARGLLLLFARLHGPERPQLHLPDPCGSTRTQVHRISINLHPAGAVGSWGPSTRQQDKNHHHLCLLCVEPRKNHTLSPKVRSLAHLKSSPSRCVSGFKFPRPTAPTVEKGRLFKFPSVYGQGRRFGCVHDR